MNHAFVIAFFCHINNIITNVAAPTHMGINAVVHNMFGVDSAQAFITMRHAIVEINNIKHIRERVHGHVPCAAIDALRDEMLARQDTVIEAIGADAYALMWDGHEDVY